MPDPLTPASRARVALASALWDAQHHHAHARERIRVEVDEEALLAAVELQITAAVEEEAQPLREALRGMLESYDLLETQAVAHFCNPMLQGVIRGAFVGEISRARAALQEPRDE